MTLVVQTPTGYDAERRYVLQVVLGDWLGLDWRLEQQERTDVRVRLEGDPDGRRVTVPEGLFGTPAGEWLTPASLPRVPLPALAVDEPGPTALRAGQPIPVLYGPTPPAGALAVPDPDGVTVGVDVLGGVFFLLSRYEEAVLAERDRYDRFSAATSVTGRGDLIAEPVADAYVEVLWAALKRSWPRLRRREHRYRVLLSHDVDDPLAALGRRPADVLRQFAADLAFRRSPGLAGRRALSLLGRDRDHRRDPHNTFDFLMRTSERHGLRSAFHFQSHVRPDPAAGALYALGHPWIRDLVRRVHERGHEVGYHAGFGTYRDPARIAAEFAGLRETAERLGVRQDRWGGRQHYLQWTLPTWRSWADAGLAYDSTVAYADAVGFRTGTSREFRVFDLAGRRPLPLHEQPLQVMDVTLFGYMTLSPDDAFLAVSRIADECRRYRGALGILWHNDAHLRTARDKRWYAALVDRVVPA